MGGRCPECGEADPTELTAIETISRRRAWDLCFQGARNPALLPWWRVRRLRKTCLLLLWLSIFVAIIPLIGNQFVVTSIGNPNAKPIRPFALYFEITFFFSRPEVRKPPFRIDFAPFGAPSVWLKYWLISLEPAANLLVLVVLAFVIAWRASVHRLVALALAAPLIALCAELLFLRIALNLAALVLTLCELVWPGVAKLAIVLSYSDWPLRAATVLWVIYLTVRLLLRIRAVAPGIIGGARIAIIVVLLSFYVLANAFLALLGI